MFQKQLISFLAFLLVWLAFGYLMGIFSHLYHPPMSVHQSAQCDRASLAQNYYYNGFKFLYPEVNEDRCTDGIVSCEFPLTNYLAACLYKVFGYNESWFRLLSYSLVSLGMFGLFLLFRLYLQVLPSLLLVMLLNASPIILFYSANFLPDISSLGLGLAAWYLFFRIHMPHRYHPAFNSTWPQIFMILCLSLAIASKTTSAIQWMTMCSVWVLSYIPGLHIQLLQKRKLAFNLACSLVIPVAWYLWSRHLSQEHNSQYFMMSVPVSESSEAYRTAWHIYLANWPKETFSKPLIYIAVSLFLVVILLKRYITNALWFVAVINFLGSAAFLCLMIEQFKYHDYYVICLVPAFAFSWLALADASRALKPSYWWVKVSAFILLLFALKHQAQCGSKNLEERYTPGNYWEQSHLKAEDYQVFRTKLDSAGINRNMCVVAGHDNAPNNMLYLLHLRGHRFSKDHDFERINHIISGSKPVYLISNDSSFTETVRPIVKSLELTVSYKYLHAYRIRY